MKSQLAIAVLAALCMNACSKSESNPQPKAFSKGSIEEAIRTGQTTPQDASEELALAAEQLAQSASFGYAQRLAKLSLAIDSTNVRARLWAAILAPTMELKGFMTRIEPMASKNPKRLRKYLDAKERISEDAPVKSVRDFFFNGPKDIQSEDEIQDTLSAVTLRMDELRQTLKDLKNEELTVYRNPETVTQEERWKEAQNSCSASSENGTITLHGCDLSNAYQVKMNSADFAVMAQVVAGYQVYVGVLNTYSVHGAANVAEFGNMGSANTLQALLADPKFGKVRDARTLAVIPEIAVDSVLAARSAIQLQRDLCRQQGQPTWTRDGYLIGEGSCQLPDDGFDAALKTIEALAKGPASVAFHVKGRNEIVKMDVPAFTKAPLADVRSLGLSSNGRCTSIADDTLGGLFPDHGLRYLVDCQ